MKASSLNEIKKELAHMSPSKVLELCMRLAKYKKENKELLTYLLFESHNEEGYIKSIIAEIDTLFKEVPRGNLYTAKKGLRKILKFANKQIKYSGEKDTEVQVRLYFCKKLRNSGISIHSSTALSNLYLMQVKKINSAIDKLHEDLQYDYRKEVELL